MGGVSKVSVAIATYNRAAMVRQAVEAALAQTRSPDEVVVFDDASPDDTLRRLDGFDARVRVLRQEKNTGGIPNWNAALDATTGDYLAWCSDDDRFIEDHLQASVEFLEVHPEVGFVHSGFVDAVETTTGFERLPRPLRFQEARRVDSRNLIPYMVRYYDWPFHPSTIVMRRRVWKETGAFDPAYALADTDWFVRAVERFPAVLLPRHGVLNRRHPGNWSNRLGSAQMQAEIYQIVESAIERRYRGLALWFWKKTWRANVRLRLGLTVRARVRSGHADAACAAWRQMFDGLRLGPLARGGEKAIRILCVRRGARFEDARESVSPL
jgi:glycosyltransferase involved in cell wall biosynthesis